MSPAAAPSGPLAKSRRTVMHLAMLFGLDSFGGGFAVQTLHVLWLCKHFALSMELMASVFSQRVSFWLAARSGLVRTMVYTCLPGNVFLIAPGLAPSASLAVAFLLLRASRSQMDVPARQADSRDKPGKLTEHPISDAGPPAYAAAPVIHARRGHQES